MAKYRKIDPRIWNDEDFRAMSDSGKLVFLFVLTHPHMTSLGAMRATIPGLASELGMAEKAFREAFREALRKPMLKHDETASFVWAVNFLKYNPPESPNVVKSWIASLDLLPECRLYFELLEAVCGHSEGYGEAFTKALPKAFRKASPYQEQEHEQEHEQSTKVDVCVSTQTKRTRFTPPTIEEVTAYCAERSRLGNPLVDAQRFHSYYLSNGWRVGKNPMRDWQAAVRQWERNTSHQPQQASPQILRTQSVQQWEDTF